MNPVRQDRSRLRLCSCLLDAMPHPFGFERFKPFRWDLLSLRTRVLGLGYRRLGLLMSYRGFLVSFLAQSETRIVFVVGNLLNLYLMPPFYRLGASSFLLFIGSAVSCRVVT